MTNDGERHLVQAAQSGDRAAFEELVRRTHRLVYARLYLDTGDVHRAEDLLQETFLLAFRSLSSLKNPDHLRSWLGTIAQNVLTDDIRHHGRRKRAQPPKAASETIDHHHSGAASPVQEAEQAETRKRVLAVLRELPEEYRAPLTLRYFSGADYDTISQQLGLTNGSLRGLLYRGLKMLRDRLGPDFP